MANKYDIACVLCNGGGDPAGLGPTLHRTTPATTKCVSIRARLACLPVHLIHRHRTKYDILWGLWIDWYCYFLQTHCKYHSLFTELISLVSDLGSLLSCRCRRAFVGLLLSIGLGLAQEYLWDLPTEWQFGTFEHTELSTSCPKWQIFCIF